MDGTTARRFDWTDENKGILTRMWSERQSSGAIARRLGDVSRNAVMGMVNRLGLMGRGGSGPNSPTVSAQIRAMFKDAAGERHRSSRRGHDEMLVSLAIEVCGRDPDCISTTARLPKANVRRALSNLHDSGVWPEGEPTPPHWSDGRSRRRLARHGRARRLRGAVTRET